MLVIEEKLIPQTDRQERQMYGKTLLDGIDLAERTVSGLASSISVDRDGEIVLPSAIAARLKRFQSGSSPLSAAHAHRTDSGSPSQIGWVVDVQVERQQVPCKFRFAQTASAEEWWKLASDPHGKGVQFSIGFIPHRYVSGTAKDLAAAYPEIRHSLRDAQVADDQVMIVYTDIELLEIACCMVACNHDCQQLSSKSLSTEAQQSIAEAVKSAVKDCELQIADCKLEKLQKAITSDVKAFVLEQFDELKACLPDSLESKLSAAGGDGDELETGSAEVVPPAEDPLTLAAKRLSRQ